jgi:hypothetical protein
MIIRKENKHDEKHSDRTVKTQWLTRSKVCGKKTERTDENI